MKAQQILDTKNKNINIKALKLIAFTIYVIPLAAFADILSKGQAGRKVIEDYTEYINKELTKKQTNMKTLLRYIVSILINTGFLFLMLVIYKYIVNNFPEVTEKTIIIIPLCVIWILGLVVSCGYVFNDNKK